MAEYYKYAERSADSQLNWAEIGKQASDMLADVSRIREEKKAAYEKSTNDIMNSILDAPQGSQDDANTFINNYAHDSVNQMKINYDLFKSGKMSERDYTLALQNKTDSTNRIYGAQKKYIEKTSDVLKGMEDGRYQKGFNTFNMKDIGKFTDFSNSKVICNQDGTATLVTMKDAVIDGKTVKVIDKNQAVSDNVLQQRVGQTPLKFNVDKETKTFVDGLGDMKDALYHAASTSRAGSITELTGLDFIKTMTNSADKAIVENVNNAINSKIQSYFTGNGFNLTSVLTDDIGGKYSDNSFTFDKDEAEKDPSKILLKINPNSRQAEVDTSSKHYADQQKEATDWVRTQILSKMDKERSIKTTPQAQLQERRPKTEAELRAEKETDEANAFARQIWNITSGNAVQRKDAATYFQTLLEDEKGKPTGRIHTTPEGVEIIMNNGETKLYKYNEGNNSATSREFGGQLVSALNTRGINEDKIGTALDKVFKPYHKVNTKDEASGYERNVNTEVDEKLRKITSDNFTNKKSQKVIPIIQDIFSNWNANHPDDKVEIEYDPYFNNKITISKKGVPPLELNSNEKTKEANAHKENFDAWVKNNFKENFDDFLKVKKNSNKFEPKIKNVQKRIGDY